ncbi:MAG: aspartyl protease family protein [Cyclobacteriaceae bacterium]
MRSICAIILFLIVESCSLSNYQRQGRVAPKSYHQTISFTTFKSVITLPVEVDGEYRNFLFDTGAQLSLLQSDETKGKRMSVSGASKRKVWLYRHKVSSMRIGDVDFKKVNVLSGDFTGLKEQIPDFGGLIGQSILNKANWKIDYPNRTLEVSNTPFPLDSMHAIPIIRSGGSPYADISIAGTTYRAIIDLGSSAKGLNVPDDHPLAQRLMDKFTFEGHTRDIYTMGGLQTVTERVGTLPFVWLSGVGFKDVPVDIRNSSDLRIGMNFFKDCVLVIDNDAGVYRLRKRIES